MGVGPGDPSLLTLAAVEAIRQAEVVAYPVGRLGADSHQRETPTRGGIDDGQQSMRPGTRR